VKGALQAAKYAAIANGELQAANFANSANLDGAVDRALCGTAVSVRFVFFKNRKDVRRPRGHELEGATEQIRVVREIRGPQFPPRRPPAPFPA
jgi:hypothetical protein